MCLRFLLAEYGRQEQRKGCEAAATVSLATPSWNQRLNRGRIAQFLLIVSG